MKGSSKLDFHMVGAVDFDDNTATSSANVTNVDNLNSGESDYAKVKMIQTEVQIICLSKSLSSLVLHLRQV